MIRSINYYDLFANSLRHCDSENQYFQETTAYILNDNNPLILF